MSAEYQDKMYDAKYPLIHSQLVKDKHLYYHNSPHELYHHPKPHVVIAGHAGLMSGEAEVFYGLWKANPENVMILTDMSAHDFGGEGAMKIISCPIGNSLSLRELVERLRPVALACADNPSSRAQAAFLPQSTTFMQPFVPVKFPIDQCYVNGVITEKSLKVMEAKEPLPLVASGQRLYSLLFSGSVIVPNSVKCLGSDVSFVVKIKSSRASPDVESQVMSGDALVSKYISTVCIFCASNSNVNIYSPRCLAAK